MVLTDEQTAAAETRLRSMARYVMRRVGARTEDVEDFIMCGWESLLHHEGLSYAISEMFEWWSEWQFHYRGHRQNTTKREVILMDDAALEPLTAFQNAGSIEARDILRRIPGRYNETLRNFDGCGRRKREQVRRWCRKQPWSGDLAIRSSDNTSR